MQSWYFHLSTCCNALTTCPNPQQDASQCTVRLNPQLPGRCAEGLRLSRLKYPELYMHAGDCTMACPQQQRLLRPVHARGCTFGAQTGPALCRQGLLQQAIDLARRTECQVALDLASFEVVRAFQAELQAILSSSQVACCFCNEVHAHYHHPSLLLELHDHCSGCPCSAA